MSPPFDLAEAGDESEMIFGRFTWRPPLTSGPPGSLPKGRPFQPLRKLIMAAKCNLAEADFEPLFSPLFFPCFRLGTGRKFPVKRPANSLFWWEPGAATA
jgi:hypothetical protein